MSVMMEEEIKRWTAQVGAGTGDLQGKTTV